MSMNECCTVENNKLEVSREKNKQGILIKKVCQLCSRNHYELLVDAISLKTELELK